MHRLSHQLHPSALEHLGLVSTARSLCKEISQVSGIQIDFNELCVPRSIPKDVSLCLYRVLQESLRDIANHSGAQEAHVKFTGTVDSVQLCVCDPGVLQDYGELSLASMRERVHQVGGEFSIEPQVSGGTQLKVSIPFAHRSLES
jgi:signal transduction histidine kinase